jgi:hypothetical protein
MTKEETKNILTWILLCIVSFTLFGLGLSKNKEGYGTTGRIRKELTPIVENFNKIRNIKNSSFPIEAKYKNKKIEIKYKNPSANTTYIFEYNKDNTINLLTTTYPKSNEEHAQVVISNLVEAISMTHQNHEGAIFEKYNYANFYQTESHNGFSLKENNGIVTATLAINVNLLKQIEDLFFEDTKISYISYDDLKELEEQLETNKTYSLTKGTIKLYVVEKEKTYIIYCSDEQNNSNDLYNSILAAVNILEPTIYDEISQTSLNITAAIIKKNYEIQINPIKIDNDYEITGNPLIKFIIKKQQ